MKLVPFAMVALLLAVAGLLLASSRPAAGQTTGVPERRTATNDALSNLPGVGRLYVNEQGDALSQLVQEESKYERAVAKLVAEYGRTESDTQRGQIKSKLADVLDKEFELQQKRRDLEVTRIETQLKKLRELIRRRNEARQTIVERRLDQLLREADGLGWTPPPQGGNTLQPGARPLFESGQPRVR